VNKILPISTVLALLLIGCESSSSDTNRAPSDGGTPSAISTTSSSSVASVSESELMQLTDAKRVTQAHFDFPPTLISRDDFIEELNAEDEFYNNEPETNSSIEDEEIINCINNIVYTPESGIQDNGSYYSEIGIIDISECYNIGNEESEYVSFLYSDYRDNILFYDENNESIDFLNNDDSYSDIENFIYASARQLRVLNTQFLVDEQSYKAVSLYSFTSSQDFTKACVEKNNQVDCMIRNLMYYTKDGAQIITNSSSFLLDVTSYDGKYYDSGNIQFSINNWNGIMTYSDDNTPPTYEATNDSDIVSGTFFEMPEDINITGYSNYTKTLKENGSFILEFDFESGIEQGFFYSIGSKQKTEILDEKGEFFFENLHEIGIMASDTVTCKPIDKGFTCKSQNRNSYDFQNMYASSFDLLPSPYLYLIKTTLSLDHNSSEVVDTIMLNGIHKGLIE